jgi:hypothetical protein
VDPSAQGATLVDAPQGHSLVGYTANGQCRLREFNDVGALVADVLLHPSATLRAGADIRDGASVWLCVGAGGLHAYLRETASDPTQIDMTHCQLHEPQLRAARDGHWVVYRTSASSLQTMLTMCTFDNESPTGLASFGSSFASLPVHDPGRFVYVDRLGRLNFTYAASTIGIISTLDHLVVDPFDLSFWRVELMRRNGLHLIDVTEPDRDGRLWVLFERSSGDGFRVDALRLDGPAWSESVDRADHRAGRLLAGAAGPLWYFEPVGSMDGVYQTVVRIRADVVFDSGFEGGFASAMGNPEP